MEYVYVVDLGSRVKIGYSTNVKRRILQIQNATGQAILRSYFVEAGRTIEKRSHYALEQYRLPGEYFSCSFDIARQTVLDALTGKIAPQKVSEAQKRAANKYNREHMATLGCKVRKEEATAFKEYAADQGKTANTVLKEYVLDCIKDNQDK